MKRERSRTPVARRVRRRTSLLAHGEPMVWMTGGALATGLMMVFALLLFVIWRGGRTFWPGPVVQIEASSGQVFLGEVAATETYVPTPDGAAEQRVKLRTGNFRETGTHFDWVNESDVATRSIPGDAALVERFDGGRFYGTPVAFVVSGKDVATEAGEIWSRYEEERRGVTDRLAEIHELETKAVGSLNARLEDARLDMRLAEMEHGKDSPEWLEASETYDRVFAECDESFERVRMETDALSTENDRYGIRFVTAAGNETTLPLGLISRAYLPNAIGFFDKVGVYLSRWKEFLTEEPRESNSEGGVFPAIFGTVVMTLLMSVLVVPFGVLAALYLREYAKQGALVSLVRIAVGNLAGVPSIVFGVFGLGFFCYIIGARIDELFFSATLPNPTFGKGGIMWASLTLALLTLPVVIVATEEALAAVPNSMREGSYACGASKWQTIRRIVLPRATPGIMTGMILAIARGAGEVAPLMLVGASKLAPKLPIDGSFPFLHPERSFMHLGFHIYDVGFQSQNSEAAIPLVFTTTLLLIAIVVILNVFAMWIRSRLRRKYQAL